MKSWFRTFPAEETHFPLLLKSEITILWASLGWGNFDRQTYYFYVSCFSREAGCLHLNLRPQNWFLCFLALIGVLAGWGTHQNRGKLHKNSQKTAFVITTIFFTFQPGHFFVVKTCYLSPNCKEWLILRLGSWKPLSRGFGKWSWFWLECRKIGSED